MTQDHQNREGQRIRHALQQLDAATPPHNLPDSGEAWSRLQFRLAYQPRKNKSAPNASTDTSTLLAALYVLAFLLWTTQAGWISAGLLAVLAAAAAASLFLVLRASRIFSN